MERLPTTNRRTKAPAALVEGIASAVMQTTLWVNRPRTPPVSEPL